MSMNEKPLGLRRFIMSLSSLRNSRYEEVPLRQANEHMMSGKLRFKAVIEI